MNIQIYGVDTNEVIHRLVVCAADDPKHPMHACFQNEGNL